MPHAAPDAEALGRSAAPDGTAGSRMEMLGAMLCNMLRSDTNAAAQPLMHCWQLHGVAGSDAATC